MAPPHYHDVEDDDDQTGHTTIDNSLNDLTESLADLKKKNLRCRLINKGKQVPMYYETPNPFSDVGGSTSGLKISTLAKAQFLRGEIVRDRYSSTPLVNDGSINYHMYSYVVSFWWVVSSIFSPVTIALLIFVWQYNSVSELNNDKAKSKFLGIVTPLLDMIAVPASYDITILKKGGMYNNELLRPFLGLVVVIYILYSIFKEEENSWSLWIFTIYSILIISFILLIILVLLPGSYWYEKEALLGKGPMPIVVCILSYFVITYFVESYVIMDMQRLLNI